MDDFEIKQTCERIDKKIQDIKELDFSSVTDFIKN